MAASNNAENGNLMSLVELYKPTIPARCVWIKFAFCLAGVGDLAYISYSQSHNFSHQLQLQSQLQSQSAVTKFLYFEMPAIIILMFYCQTWREKASVQVLCFQRPGRERRTSLIRGSEVVDNP